MLDIQSCQLEETKNILGKHDLCKLWNKVKQLIMKIWPDSPHDDLKATEKIILEFHRIDKTGQAFRYPHNRNGKKLLQNTSDKVDLDNLKKVMDAVSSFLDAVCAGINEFL